MNEAEIVACCLFACVFLVIGVYWYTEKTTTDRVRRALLNDVSRLVDAHTQEMAATVADLHTRLTSVVAQQARLTVVETQVRNSDRAMQAVEQVMQAYRKEIQTLRQENSNNIERLKEDLLTTDAIQTAVVAQQARLTAVEGQTRSIVQLDKRIEWAEHVLRAAIERQKEKNKAPEKTDVVVSFDIVAPYGDVFSRRSLVRGRAAKSVVTDRHLWVNKPTHAKKRNDQSRLSRQVREAANWTCQQCGVVLRGGYSYLLHMHHIDGDHTNNKEENLMALCVECHSQKDGLGHRLLGEEIACDGRLKRLHRLRRAQRGGA